MSSSPEKRDGPPVETINDQLVGVAGDQITLVRPLRRMTRPQALRLAAWLVVLADPTPDQSEFRRVLDAVLRT